MLAAHATGYSHSFDKALVLANSSHACSVFDGISMSTVEFVSAMSEPTCPYIPDEGSDCEEALFSVAGNPFNLARLLCMSLSSVRARFDEPLLSMSPFYGAGVSLGVSIRSS